MPTPTDFCVIESVTVEIASDGLSQDEDEVMGSTRRRYDGTLVTTERTVKRAWTIRTGPMTDTQLQTLKGALATNGMGTGGLGCSCVGLVFGGTVTAQVKMTDAPYHDVGGTDFMRFASLKVREV